MPITKGFRALVDEANAQIATYSVEQVRARMGSDPTLQIVDIRDPRELEHDGKVPCAFHAPRGMLEFWIDPESPYHKPRFAEGKTYVFYCASGWRSLLAARVAQEMGLDARSLRGGFGGWKASGKPVAEREKSGR